MTQYIGVKIVEATPMNLLAFQKEFNRNVGYQGITDDTGDCEGYLVSYPQPGNQPSLYQAWSPSEVFEEAYRTTDGMPFGLATEAMKKGLKVARAGWNGRGMFIRLVGATAELNAHFEIFNVHGRYDTWVASVSDALTDDWTVVE
jgi:hypothetical protein